MRLRGKVKGLTVFWGQLVLLLFWSAMAQAGGSLELVKEVQRNLAAVERRMAEEPEEATRILEEARRLADELRAMAPDHPNLPGFRAKMERLVSDLRRWRREAVRRNEGLSQPLLTAEAADQ